MTKHLERVVLPTPLPFDGVDFYRRPSTRYRSFDVSGLIVHGSEGTFQSEGISAVRFVMSPFGFSPPPNKPDYR
jgi:hypothetical protein